MQPDTHLIQAWESLRRHWIINPTGNGIPATPIYSILRLIIPPLVRPLLRLSIRGSHNIPRKGATILAANHLSHIDPIMVIASSRRTTHYLAKDGHFENPVLRTVMQSTGQIETQREAGASAALASAADILVANRALGIFPEGTRSKRTASPFLLPGKTGVARLAASYPNSVVIPIALMGTRQCMQPQHHKFPRPWKKLDFHAGEGITWLQWLADPAGGDMSSDSLSAIAQGEDHEIRAALAKLYRKFTDQLMGSIAALGAP
jgi:1-acyl-sn-glycerol-3-phosphate acyltransferase